MSNCESCVRTVARFVRYRVTVLRIASDLVRVGRVECRRGFFLLLTLPAGVRGSSERGLYNTFHTSSDPSRTPRWETRRATGISHSPWHTTVPKFKAQVRVYHPGLLPLDRGPTQPQHQPRRPASCLGRPESHILLEIERIGIPSPYDLCACILRCMQHGAHILPAYMRYAYAAYHMGGSVCARKRKRGGYGFV